MESGKHVIDLAARKRGADASLHEWLHSELRQAKALGKTVGTPRHDLVFAEQKRN